MSSSTRIPPSPPNPHLAVMPVSVDTSLQPQYVTSPADKIKTVVYPYNLVKEFTVTFYSKKPANEGDEAVLYDSDGNFLTSAPLTSGAPLTFDSFTYYPHTVKFMPKDGLPSRDIKVKLPLDLFSPSERELNFKLGEFVVPDPE
jgi:hypothetical protein